MLKQLARRQVAGVLFVSLVALQATALADGRFVDARLVVGKQEVVGVLISDATAKHVSFDSGGSVPFEIPFTRIKSMHYERASHPRYAAGLLVAWPLLFTKSKKHYLTIQYLDESGQGKFQIVRLDKDNVRVALDTLEADAGLTIDRSEER